MITASTSPATGRNGKSTAAGLLRATFAAHRLTAPKDLASGIGSAATTLWSLNAAQTLVVANTTRDATSDLAAAAPFDCGRIAATAALSAVHACAATPLFARLTLACPATTADDVRQSLVDGVAVAMDASAAVLADVDIVDAAALRFDVLVAGVVRPDRVRGVAGAQPGDALILSGPLGGGIYAAAQVRRKLSDEDRRVLTTGSIRSNGFAVGLGTIRNVHAVAAVGPNGLIEAALAMSDASSLPATLDVSRVPALPHALDLARAGSVAPASSRNWNRDGARVALADRVMPEMRNLLTDPVMSGVLLIACKAESIDRVLKLCNEGADTGAGPASVPLAAAIGTFGPGAAPGAAVQVVVTG